MQASYQAFAAVKIFDFYKDTDTADERLKCYEENSIVLLDEELTEFSLQLSLMFKENDLQASLKMEKSSSCDRDRFIWYEIALFDFKDNVDIIKKGSCNLETISNDEQFVNICTRNYLLRNLGYRFLHDDKLSISLKSCIGAYQDIQLPKPAQELSLARENLFDYYKNLYETKDFSDIILAIGSKEIPAHKSVLVSRSPVFRAMFRRSFKEAKSNRVEITDMDPDVLEDLIRFIYTSECPSIAEKPMEMLAAADKYDIESLRLLCEEVLSEQANSKNAIDLLVCADRHSATALKKKALEIIRHYSNIDTKKIDLIVENAERLKELLIE